MAGGVNPTIFDARQDKGTNRSRNVSMDSSLTTARVTISRNHRVAAIIMLEGCLHNALALPDFMSSNLELTS